MKTVLVATLLLAAALLPAAVHAAEAPTPKGPVAIPADGKLDPESFPKVGDPETLFAVGDAWLAAGDKETATKAFEAAYLTMEVNTYAPFAGRSEQKALLAERLGDLEGADKAWDKAFATSPSRATLFASRYAQGERRAKLLTRGAAAIAELAAKLDAGEPKVQLFLTSKGEARWLEKWPEEKVWEAIEAGTPMNRVYIPVLDLTKGPPERPAPVPFAAPGGRLPRKGAAVVVAPPPAPTPAAGGTRVYGKQIVCQRCVIGKILAWSTDLQGGLDLTDSVVLGEVHFGKRWAGEVNRSAQLPPARLGGTTQAFYGLFLGPVNFEGVKFGRLASFPFGTFVKGADFRAAEFGGAAEFRFASFSGPANFKGATFNGSAYLGHTRFEGPLTFTKTRLPRNRLYFNLAEIGGSASFDEGEWALGATFEGARFGGSTTFKHNLVRGPCNFSRAHFVGPFDMVESVLDGLDLFGARIDGPMKLQSNQFFANVRFSLDSVTRKRFSEDLAGLDAYYKLYKGDDDVEDEINPGPQYGVTKLDDLTARIRGDLSMANSIFKTFLIMEGVQFGSAEAPIVTDFFNTQFGTETHFERAAFFGRADFQTVFGQELAFNDATFHGAAVFDDANIPGRLTFTGATFESASTLSMYGAVIGNLGLDREQILRAEAGYFTDQPTRLAYETCAIDARKRKDYLGDRRMEEITAEQLQGECYARAADEYSSLRGAFDAAAKPEDADWSYWWMMHHKNKWQVFGDGQSIGTRFAAVGRYLIFECAFGWGVHLGNIFLTAILLVFFYVFLFYKICPDSVVQFDGDDLRIRDIPFHGVLTISAHCIINTNVGWDGGQTDRSFKLLMTSEAALGIILITFFIGAYTRMVLA